MSSSFLCAALSSSLSFFFSLSFSFFCYWTNSFRNTCYLRCSDCLSPDTRVFTLLHVLGIVTVKKKCVLTVMSIFVVQYLPSLCLLLSAWISPPRGEKALYKSCYCYYDWDADFMFHEVFMFDYYIVNGILFLIFSLLCGRPVYLYFVNTLFKPL